MGEFLEFIRQQHIKLHGKKKNMMKRIKGRDEMLDHDSISEITDLSQEGILNTSLQMLSKKDQHSLDKYNQQFKRVVAAQAPKHNCFAEVPAEKKRRVNNSRYLVAMELRAKSEPKFFEDKEHSAH